MSGPHGRLAIIAGSGMLPVYVAEAARAAGEDPFILPLKDEADQRWEGFQSSVIGVGDMAGLSSLIKRHGIKRVVMSGGVKNVQISKRSTLIFVFGEAAVCGQNPAVGW